MIQLVFFCFILKVHTEKIEEEAMDNLKALVCNTYQGTKPAACSQHLEQSKYCDVSE